MATAVQLYKRTNNLSESNPRMTSSSQSPNTVQYDSTSFKGGQNFSVPLHDNNKLYRYIETGLIKIQSDHCSEGVYHWVKDNSDKDLPPVKPGFDLHGVNGCALSQGANRTYHLEVGEYFLETMASFVMEACNNFNVQMVCSGGATTNLPAESDPLGFSVDAKSGAITGTPQVERDGYRMRLRAVDAVDARTDVAEWTFNVKKKPLFSVNPATGWSAELDGKLASKYHMGEAHLLPRPRFPTAELLQYPAAGRFQDVVYLLSAEAAPGNANCTAEKRAISALTDVKTGEGAINVECEGDYSAKLVVRDGAGAEVTLRSWNFTVRQRDTNVAEYGPNQRGCDNGKPRDGETMDKSFTCDCDGTKFTGDNCERMSDQGDATAAVIGAVLAVLVVSAVAVAILFKWQRHARSMLATDFFTQLELMKERGDVDDEQLSVDRVPRELKRRWLALIDKLGHGAFGDVRQCIPLPTRPRPR